MTRQIATTCDGRALEIRNVAPVTKGVTLDEDGEPIGDVWPSMQAAREEAVNRLRARMRGSYCHFNDPSAPGNEHDHEKLCIATFGIEWKTVP